MLNTALPGAPQLKAEFKSTFGESPAEREGALPDEYDPRNETYDKVRWAVTTSCEGPKAASIERWTGCEAGAGEPPALGLQWPNP